ncbi:hypothetical protein [uncultured Gammaproteobacteria bacterium]|nr:hypothetical protein [uncultured Gammaproteobacteria bacterium]
MLSILLIYLDGFRYSESLEMDCGRHSNTAIGVVYNSCHSSMRFIKNV